MCVVTPGQISQEPANLATGSAGQRPGCAFTATCWQPGMSLHLAGSKSVIETTSDTNLCLRPVPCFYEGTGKTREKQWPASQWLACDLISGRSLTGFISSRI